MIKEVEVNGKKYKLQKLPVRPALELRQRANKDGSVDDILFYEELLEHIVVEPKLELDDFEDVNELEKLMVEVMDFQYMGK